MVSLVLAWLVAAIIVVAILKVIEAGESIIQVKTVLALAAVLLALGVTYWLVRDRDSRQAPR